jgi:hypothetical protein
LNVGYKFFYAPKYKTTLTELTLTKLSTFFVYKPNAEFHENLTNSLVVDRPNRSRAARQTDMVPVQSCNDLLKNPKKQHLTFMLKMPNHQVVQGFGTLHIVICQQMGQSVHTVIYFIYSCLKNGTVSDSDSNA